MKTLLSLKEKYKEQTGEDLAGGGGRKDKKDKKDKKPNKETKQETKKPVQDDSQKDHKKITRYYYCLVTARLCLSERNFSSKFLRKYLFGLQLHNVQFLYDYKIFAIV